MANTNELIDSDLNVNKTKFYNSMSKKNGLVKLTRLEVKNYNRFNNQLDKLKENNGVAFIRIKGHKVFYDPVDICFYKLM